MLLQFALLIYHLFYFILCVCGGEGRMLRKFPVQTSTLHYRIWYSIFLLFCPDLSPSSTLFPFILHVIPPSLTGRSEYVWFWDNLYTLFVDYQPVMVVKLCPYLYLDAHWFHRETTVQRSVCFRANIPRSSALLAGRLLVWCFKDNKTTLVWETIGFLF